MAKEAVDFSAASPAKLPSDFIRAAQTLKSEGSFAGLASLVPYVEINGLFATDLRGQQRQGR